MTKIKKKSIWKYIYIGITFSILKNEQYCFKTIIGIELNE